MYAKYKVVSANLIVTLACFSSIVKNETIKNRRYRYLLQMYIEILFSWVYFFIVRANMRFGIALDCISCN
ncbi:hypothetical protein X975_14321, partial [Stegodyphus mimosarum]